MFITQKINKLEPTQSNRRECWSEIDLCESVHFFHIKYIDNTSVDACIKNKLIANIELLAQHIENGSLEMKEMNLISPPIKIDDSECWKMTRISGVSVKEKNNSLRMLYLYNGVAISSDALDILSDPDKHGRYK